MRAKHGTRHKAQGAGSKVQAKERCFKVEMRRIRESVIYRSNGK
jgi:hypothetical protein